MVKREREMIEMIHQLISQAPRHTFGGFGDLFASEINENPAEAVARRMIKAARLSWNTRV